MFPESFAVNRFSAYGYRTHSRGGRLAFNGERQDPHSGCYHLGNGHRAYNCVLMRFHTPDSLSPFADGGLNAYAYCSGDPVNRRDPTGRFFESAVLSLRGLGMASNAATLAYNFLGPAPTNRVGLNAARISSLGSLLSVASATAQFAGVESAIFGANVGTATSLAATGVRAVNAAFGSGAQPLTQIKRNYQLLTSGVPPQPAQDIPLDTVRVSELGGVEVRESIIRRSEREVRSKVEITVQVSDAQELNLGIRLRRNVRRSSV